MTKVLVFSKSNPIKDWKAAKWNLQFLCAKNQQEAIRILETNTIHVVVVDLENREQEGLAFVSCLRGVQRFYLLPVILLAKDDAHESLAFHVFHCFDYVIKPLEKERLEKLLYWIGGRFDKKGAAKALVINTRLGIHMFEAKDILYLEICNKMLYVHTRYDVFSFPYRKLGVCMEQCGGDLVQCHRSIAVNCLYVEKIDYVNRQICLVKQYGNVALGRKYMKGLRKQFDERTRISYTDSVFSES